MQGSFIARMGDFAIFSSEGLFRGEASTNHDVDSNNCCQQLGAFDNLVHLHVIGS